MAYELMTLEKDDRLVMIECVEKATVCSKNDKRRIQKTLNGEANMRLVTLHREDIRKVAMSVHSIMHSHHGKAPKGPLKDKCIYNPVYLSRMIQILMSR